MTAEKDLEGGQLASPDSSRSQLQGPEGLEKASQSNFRNGLHEIIFVWVVTSAQWVTVFYSLAFIDFTVIDARNTIAS